MNWVQSFPDVLEPRRVRVLVRYLHLVVGTVLCKDFGKMSVQEDDRLLDVSREDLELDVFERM